MQRSVTKEEMQHYEEHGYVILQQWFDPQEVNKLNEQFTQLWMDLVREGTIKQDKQKLLESIFPRLRDYHLTHPQIASIMLSDKMFAAAKSLLQEPALAISTSYYFKSPGTRGLPMHQDNYSVGSTPNTTCSLWVSLSEGNKQNGGIFIVPQSHTAGLLEPHVIASSEEEYGEKLHLENGQTEYFVHTKPGDVIAFHGNLMHGSYENQTKNEFRKAFVVHFTGESTKAVSLNHQKLINQEGEQVRRRLNLRRKQLKTDTLKQSEWSGIGGNKPWK
ncbi:phytanoyl-CoA dioxygenase family protein [Longirhabdus pacifica]|uniref:phytanoyl-CoA dioxygenase family protein n=1 Tax=Longirhabdus pacifica TaxID=2305227 RepID=UPI001008B85A|nr:phytanoyl-CoA dioxygenase family protein [Longirhabdus pacifica]